MHGCQVDASKGLSEGGDVAKANYEITRIVALPLRAATRASVCRSVRVVLS